MEELEPLNQKIADIVSVCEGPDATFADLVDIKRPILSHILKGRNKPSLEVIQKIVKVFPKLGLQWTFDSEELDEDTLNYVAAHFKDLTSQKKLFSESSISEERSAQSEIFNSQGLPFMVDNSEEIAQILIIYKNGRFVTLNPMKPNVKS